jgi:hypothetical protein
MQPGDACARITRCVASEMPESFDAARGSRTFSPFGKH